MGQNSGGINWTPTCHECGEKGHTRPNCPHRATPNPQTGNGFNKKIGPSAGEPAVKTHQGTTFKWCDTCKKWNSGTKAHLTSEHIKGKGATAPVTAPVTTTAALAETAPSASATLAFISGYMGMITEIEDPYPIDVDTKFIIDKDGHASILSVDGVHSNHSTADFCPFCQQYFPENSGHNSSNLHLKNVQMMRGWECSEQQLDFCTETLLGMAFVRDGFFEGAENHGTFTAMETTPVVPEEVVPEEVVPEEVLPEEVPVAPNQEIDEEGFVTVVRKSKRAKRTHHLNSNAGQR
jgi:hypothetical protein